MHFKMVNIGSKEPTQRRAIAQGVIRMSGEAFSALRDGTNPKGNVLALAEVAGIMGAKRTSDLIPLCHPLLLDQVQLSFTLNEREYSVTAVCEVMTTAKTGVEMEALSGVNGALLAIYDLCKAVNPNLVISDIRLNLKEGGKSGTWVHPDVPSNSTEQITLPLVLKKEVQEVQKVRQAFEGFSVSVITISDRVSAGKMEDTGGPSISEFFRSRGAIIRGSCVIPDDKLQIQEAVIREVRENRSTLVITTGGTGLGPRDRTPEAIQEICDRTIPGFGECLRSKGQEHTSFAWLSRSLGVMLDHSIVIALPGSFKAVAECLDALEELLPHALDIARGSNHDPVRT